VGATNVMRTVGVAAGLLAFLLDFAKGAIAALLAQRLDPAGGLAPLAALAAVIGHVYPVFLGFRGGKGVATGAGAFVPLAPGVVVAALLAFAVSLGLFRYVSLASLIGAGTLVFGCAVIGSPFTPHAAVVALLIAFKHRENIERLRAGTERQAFQGKEAA
jgi:glycerol-3-phosphate acyltransferase PlsY